MPCDFEIDCAGPGFVKDEADDELSLAGGRNNDALKGAQLKEEVESLSAGRNEPGTRIDDAIAAVISRDNVARGGN